jgi:two-component system cell cycle sensor histidine kinase/response regulator CckA
MLERLGHRVIATESATACLQAAAEAVGPVDLLLTDVVMPDLDGHQLLERLREARPGLKVLFMSGYPGDVVTLRGVPLDGLPLLQKPFTAEALADAVRKAMAG